MKLLLLIILFIIFFPIIKMWMLMRRARRNMEDAYDQLRRRGQTGTSSNDSGRRDDRYGDDVGEYADYEEVNGASGPETESEGPIAQEEQVVDAEFEEIR